MLSTYLIVSYKVHDKSGSLRIPNLYFFIDYGAYKNMFYILIKSWVGSIEEVLLLIMLKKDEKNN